MRPTDENQRLTHAPLFNVDGFCGDWIVDYISKQQICFLICAHIEQVFQVALGGVFLVAHKTITKQRPSVKKQKRVRVKPYKKKLFTYLWIVSKKYFCGYHSDQQ